MKSNKVPHGAAMKAVARRLAALSMFSVPLAVLVGVPVSAQVALVFSQPKAGDLRDQSAELAMKIKGSFSVVAVGDLIQMVPFSNSDDPRVQALMKVMRDADVTMANNENNIVDHLTFRGTIAHMEAPRAVADDWANMGIDIVTKANNHSFDAGEAGLWQDFAQLQRVGIQHVGVDYNLTEARMARAVYTPKGSVGLVGAYANSDRQGRWLYGLPAKDPVYVTPDQLKQLKAMRDAILARRGEVDYPIEMPLKGSDDEVLVFGVQFKAGKPGDKIVGDPSANLLMSLMGKSKARHDPIESKINDLHVIASVSVTAKQMQQLRAIAGDKGSGDTLVAFNGVRFHVGPEIGEYSYDMDQSDLRSILREIRTAKQFYDFAAATIHWHQNRYAFQAYSFDHYPADFEIKFAHDAIDQGADLFFAHGVHTLKGVEIYKGKPIFYGLSNFVWQPQQFRSWRDFGEQPPVSDSGAIEGEGESNERDWHWLEHPANFQTLMTRTVYEDGKLKEIRLYPVDLGLDGRPGSQIGIPKQPSPKLAQEILEKLVQYSKPFGTKITIENGVGIIRVAD